MWFWLPALLVVLLLVAKDPLLGFLPIVKKPLDALDVVEDKISAVLASAVVLPLLISAFSQAVPAESAGATAGPPFLLAITMPAFLSSTLGKVVLALSLIGMMAAFFITWLAAHTINVLILLSPFGPLDMLLRALKGLVLVVLMTATLIAPALGAIVSLVIVIVAWRVAGWSFRLTVFGSIFAWDTLTLKHRRLDASSEAIRAFSCRRLAALPVRTYGELRSESGERQVFAYRPWNLLPERRLPIPGGKHVVGKCLLAPVMLTEAEEGGVGDVLVRFPPRFLSHEEELAERLDARRVRLLGVRRHFGTLRRWLREVVSGNEELLTE